MHMSTLLSKTLVILAVASAPSWAAINGNPCESPIGTGAGCGTPVGLQNAGALSGGIDFGGTQYAGKCAGQGGCTPVLQPALRFWEQDNFASKDSGQALQDDAASGNFWMVNPNLDFGQSTVPNTLWIIFQANWANTGVEGCITGTRNVAEVSFCDASAVSKYVVMSVADPNIALFDYNAIVGATGTSANIVPLTDVPKPTGLPTIGAENTADTSQMDFPVTLAAGSNRWWTDVAPGANDPANQLVKGIEVLYQNASSLPAPACNSGLGAWLPVHNPAIPAANLGPQAPGTFIVTVPKPAVGPPSELTYVTARVVYVDAATSCGVAQPCLDPATQGTPTSCFNEIAGPVDYGIAVSFASVAAKRELGSNVSITWQTTSESNTVGFTVERSSSMAGPWTAVGGFVGAMGSGSSYKTIDQSAAPSATFFYRVREMASSGAPSISSPIKVAPASGGEGGSRQRHLHP